MNPRLSFYCRGPLSAQYVFVKLIQIFNRLLLCKRISLTHKLTHRPFLSIPLTDSFSRLCYAHTLSLWLKIKLHSCHHDQLIYFPNQCWILSLLLQDSAAALIRQFFLSFKWKKSFAIFVEFNFSPLSSKTFFSLSPSLLSLLPASLDRYLFDKAKNVGENFFQWIQKPFWVGRLKPR